MAVWLPGGQPHLKTICHALLNTHLVSLRMISPFRPILTCGTALKFSGSGGSLFSAPSSGVSSGAGAGAGAGAGSVSSFTTFSSSLGISGVPPSLITLRVSSSDSDFIFCRSFLSRSFSASVDLRSGVNVMRNSCH